MNKLNDYEKNSISCLRILSCIGVFIIHLSQQISLPEPISGIASYGQDGLWVFCLLSGFLTMYSWGTKWNKCSSFMGGVRLFYVNRAYRILPIAYFWLVIIYFATVCFSRAYPAFSIEWLRSVLFLNMIWPSSDYFVWNALFIWGALSYFVLFYVVFPFLYKWIRNSLKRSMILLAITMLLRAVWLRYCPGLYMSIWGGDSNVAANMSFLSVLYYFVLGMVLCQLFQKDKLIYAIMFFLIGYLTTMHFDFMKIYEIGFFYAVFVAVVLFIGSFCGTKRYNNEQESSNGVSWIAKIERYSFPFYICHMLIFKIVDYVSVMYSLSEGVKLIILLVMPGGISMLLYHVICKPFIEKGRRKNRVV